MSEHEILKTDMLSTRLPFRPSKTVLALILATLILAALLTFSTLQNINRARDLTEQFLLQKGETIIRTVEAALRTTIMHHLTGIDELQTLLDESSREEGIVYIAITDRDGKMLAKTDNTPEPHRIATVPAEIAASPSPITSLDREQGIFTIASRLELRTQPRMTGMMMSRRQENGADQNIPFDGIITIGLLTEPFEQARRQDIRHALFMGAILFLVGSAGLYFLFLYQGMRVTRSTLANMKLYTDNVIGSIPVGVITLDAKDELVTCNHQAEEMLGRELSVMRGKPIDSVFPDSRINPDEIRGALLDASVECSTGDGRKIPLKVGGSALVNSLGEVIGTVLVLRDMSTIREMELQLERSRRMAALGKMAAGIAHEIRNPLGTLRGFAHYFGNQPGAGDESRKYADLMKSEVDRLNRTVSGLLQFARPREPQVSLVQLDDLIAKTVALMEHDFTNHSLDFHWQCNTNVQFEADPDLLLQVLLNLLKNSVGATEAGGEVSLKATADEQTVSIAVSDTGCGMSARDRERMFDPFFTTKKSGTGLGLAVSHQIVEQHRGRFAVESDPGQGTTITVVLPITARST